MIQIIKHKDFETPSSNGCLKSLALVPQQFYLMVPMEYILLQKMDQTRRSFVSGTFYVLATNSWQTISLKQCRRSKSLLNSPVSSSQQDFPIVQYVDDTLVIMEGSNSQLQFLKALLNSFAPSNGPKIKYSKSLIVPIKIGEEKLDILSQNNWLLAPFPLT